MESTTNIKLKDLGYGEFFETARKTLGLDSYPIARVTAEYKEAYRIIDKDRNEYVAKITGKQMFIATKREDFPAVGDWVIFESLTGKQAVIRKIIPRRTVLKKKYSNKQDNQIIATNIDTAFITESMDRDYNLNRFERFLVLVEEGKVKPAIILNKIDLISENDLNFRINQIKSRFNDIDIITTSIISDNGIQELKKYIIPGKTYCFLGSSGVGKSSLINKLLGKDEIKTREISLTLERGKHTTTTREMYFLDNGGLLIDNPGTREVGISESDTGLVHVFDEIGTLSHDCKFSDCTHTSEPGCAVIQAVKENRLDEYKYRNFIKLKKESEFYKMTELEKRVKDRKFGKFVKKALQGLKR